VSFYEGRLALVTGGSEGIGKAVAAQLVSRGCRVIIAARRTDVLEAARVEIGALDAITVDVTKWTQVRDALNEMVEQHAPPDLLVTCAGLAHPGWLSETNQPRTRDEEIIAEIDEMVATNLMGTIHAVKATLGHMIDSRRPGTIVTTASLGGLFGLYGYTGYCASKFGVVGFSEALRREVAPHGIGVTVLCPPNTRTPGLERENRRKPWEVLAQEEKAAVLDPDAVAKKLLDALPRRPRIVVPSRDGLAAWLISRFTPSILDRILKRPPTGESRA